ncbi:MAG: beta-ketoacyl synthase chain length factor [Methylococcales bacterium]
MHESARIYIKSAVMCCPEPELLASFNMPCLNVDNNLIPAAIRRRTSMTTRMAITAATKACQQAGVNTALLPSVFASLGGEIQVTDALCRLLPLAEALLSPTQFHNSVHNTTAGYWGILNQCQAASTAIAAVDDTFAMGLLEAYTQLQLAHGDLLLVCYDELWPQYLAPPIGQAACACALVLSTDRQQALGSISVPRIKPIASPLDEHWSALVDAVPAVAALPLLCAINTQQPAVIPLNPKGNIWFTEFESC